MTRITADIPVCLDGFVTGPDPSPDNGLGTGGEALHTWAFSDDPDDRLFLHEGTVRSGAVVLGRHLFDVVDGPKGWDHTSGRESLPTPERVNRPPPPDAARRPA